MKSTFQPTRNAGEGKVNREGVPLYTSNRSRSVRVIVCRFTLYHQLISFLQLVVCYVAVSYVGQTARYTWNKRCNYTRTVVVVRYLINNIVIISNKMLE